MAETVKHTPGPWEYRDNCIYPVSRHRCIARMDWHVRDEVDDANARLIAAAPDMLEALKAIRRHVDHPAHYDKWVDEICEAAIQKADQK